MDRLAPDFILRRKIENSVSSQKLMMIEFVGFNLPIATLQKATHYISREDQHDIRMETQSLVQVILA